MKNLFKVYILTLTTLLVLSCDNDESVISDEMNPMISNELKSDLYDYAVTTTNSNQDAEFLSRNSGCFSFEYPLTIISFGIETQINSDQDFFEYIINPENAGFQFVFPLNATLNGNTCTYSN